MNRLISFRLSDEEHAKLQTLVKEQQATLPEGVTATVTSVLKGLLATARLVSKPDQPLLDRLSARQTDLELLRELVRARAKSGGFGTIARAAEIDGSLLTRFARGDRGLSPQSLARLTRVLALAPNT